MSTKLCQDYLVEHFASWAEANYGQEAQDDMVEDAFTAGLRAEYKRIVKHAQTPSGWARISKFKVGSKADTAGSNQPRTGNNLAADYPALVGWTCRIFLLKESDSIEIALFEKDGRISTEYVDYSD